MKLGGRLSSVPRRAYDGCCVCDGGEKNSRAGYREESRPLGGGCRLPSQTRHPITIYGVRESVLVFQLDRFVILEFFALSSCWMGEVAEAVWKRA